MSDSKKVVLMIIGGAALWAAAIAIVYTAVKAFLPTASTGTAGIITAVVLFVTFAVYMRYEYKRAPEME